MGRGIMKELLQFIQLVRAMRASQKEYFRTRDKNILLQSKELERQVDNLLSADDDLFSSPSKKEGWSNMRTDGNPYIWQTRKEAEKELEKKKKAGIIGNWVIVKLEWEEE